METENRPEIVSDSNNNNNDNSMSSLFTGCPSLADGVQETTTIVSRKSSKVFKLLSKKRVISKAVPLAVIFLCVFNSLHKSPLEVYRNLQKESTETGKVNGKYKYCRSPYVIREHLQESLPPVIPYENRMDPPSHIQLCEAYLARKDLNRDKLMKLGPMKVVEDPALCLDWTSPHYSVLNIFASSLIAAKGLDLGLRYSHDCHKFLTFSREDDFTRYDYTTAQQVLAENLIAAQDAEDIDDKLVKQLCHGCISHHTNQLQNPNKPDGFSGVTHHCFLFPGGASAEKIVKAHDELPLASILSSFVDRMRHMTEDWMDATDALEFEDESGVIVGLDEKSSFMDMSFYDKAIPSPPSSIQIFASAKCAVEAMNNKSECIKHGQALKAYFKERFAGTPTYVRYDIVASTATSFARMMNAKILVCPPGSVMCLLPALGKLAGRKAYIAEDGSMPATFHWYQNLIAKRKSLGLQNVGYDAVEDEEFLIINEGVSQFQMPANLPLDELDELNARYNTPLYSESDISTSTNTNTASSFEIPMVDLSDLKVSGSTMTSDQNTGEIPVQQANDGEFDEPSETDESSIDESSESSSPYGLSVESNPGGSSPYGLSVEPDVVSETDESSIEGGSSNPSDESSLEDSTESSASFEADVPSSGAYSPSVLGRTETTVSYDGARSNLPSDEDQSSNYELAGDLSLQVQDDKYHPPLNADEFAAIGETDLSSARQYSATDLQLVPVYDFWHKGNRDHTFHLGDPWFGETKGDIQFYVYAQQVEGSIAVYDFWNSAHKDHTFHFGEPWDGEVKGDIQYYAFKDQVKGSEPVYAFWNNENTEITIHFGEPWEGERKQPTVAFYAFPSPKV